MAFDLLAHDRTLAEGISRHEENISRSLAYGIHQSYIVTALGFVMNATDHVVIAGRNGDGENSEPLFYMTIGDTDVEEQPFRVDDAYERRHNAHLYLQASVVWLRSGQSYQPFRLGAELEADHEKIDTIELLFTPCSERVSDFLVAVSDIAGIEEFNHQGPQLTISEKTGVAHEFYRTGSYVYLDSALFSIWGKPNNLLRKASRASAA